MKSWLAYVGLALLISLVGVVLALVAATGDVVRAVVFSAVLAWGIQAVAFAAVIAVRDRTNLFMFAWLGGIALRFAAVGAVAFWVTRGSGTLPPAATLVSLVAFVFVMLILEPLFMRKGRPTG